MLYRGSQSRLFHLGNSEKTGAQALLKDQLRILRDGIKVSVLEAPQVTNVQPRLRNTDLQDSTCGYSAKFLPETMKEDLRGF